jgi:site-specific recombinase XerD
MITRISTFIDDFIIAKKTEGLSERSLRLYRFVLNGFAEFLGENATIRDMTLERARAYVAQLQSRRGRYQNNPYRTADDEPLSPSTIYNCVRVIKVFSRWLADESYIASDPLVRLKRPKMPQTVVDVLSDEEIESFFAQIRPNSFKGARNMAIYMLLIDTGIRASELCTLTLDRVDLEKGEILVTGKGNKERKVQIVDNTKKALAHYLHYYRPECDNPHVFVTYDGEDFTYNALDHLTKSLGKKAGIPRLHPHLFRHTFAVKWLMNGGDVLTLRNSLGHANLSMTDHYVQLTDAQRQTKHDRYSPASSLDFKRTRRIRNRQRREDSVFA